MRDLRNHDSTFPRFAVIFYDRRVAFDRGRPKIAVIPSAALVVWTSDRKTTAVAIPAPDKDLITRWDFEVREMEPQCDCARGFNRVNDHVRTVAALKAFTSHDG